MTQITLPSPILISLVINDSYTTTSLPGFLAYATSFISQYQQQRQAPIKSKLLENSNDGIVKIPLCGSLLFDQ